MVVIQTGDEVVVEVEVGGIVVSLLECIISPFFVMTIQWMLSEIFFVYFAKK